ncbi:MFS transporter [Alcaligenes faecalis]|uniref:MFS transporter n=1 Tax=Alcaligenes faecalis TaxID=511 RepID=UPI000E14FE43|nr:MFS transporter [Alcaligenes faecalis]SSY69383.1 Inner membrane transport protein RhmT [Alcaligenes faecalis subsp. faecalis]
MTSSTLAHGSQALSASKQELDQIYKKVMWRILPFIFLLWMLAWIDRLNIGFAKLQMQPELGFSETVYGIGAGIFFLGYFFFEVPSNWLLLRIGARKTLARIAFGWGLICVLMMFTKTAAYFYVMRFLLGAFEAGFQPGVLLFLTFWFPAHRRAKAFAVFISASAVASVVGAPLAGFIMTRLDGVNDWSGWQWLFLLEGLPTIFAGILAVMFIVDSPEKASWLSQREKDLIKQELVLDAKAAGPREHSFKKALGNTDLWTLTLMFFGIVATNSTLAFFAPTLVRSLGPADPLQVGLLVGLVYVFGAIFQLALGFSADRRREARLHTGIPVIIGAVGLAGVGLFLGNNTTMAFISLIIAVSGTMGCIPVYWQLPNAVLAGSAAAIGVAFINSVANLAGFGAPFMLGALKDASGNFQSGLWIIAALELAVGIWILSFRKRKQID